MRPLVGQVAVVVVIIVLAVRLTYRETIERNVRDACVEPAKPQVESKLKGKVLPSPSPPALTARKTLPAGDLVSILGEHDAGADAEKKRECLRYTFLRGTAPVQKKVYSQWGEDGIIEAVFNCIGTKDKYYVEFGAEACTECTTRYLREKGWSGLVMDGSHSDPSINLQQEFFTAETIAEHFVKYDVPKQFDHLTIDIDLNTWWVLYAVLEAGYRPRHITSEFNRNIAPFEPIVVTYNATDMWDGSCYYGAGIAAFRNLFHHFGYFLVAEDNEGVNLYAVHGKEVGSKAPLEYPEILSGLRRDGSLRCWGIHAACQNYNWMLVPRTVMPGLKGPISDWYETIETVRMTHEDIGVALGSPMGPQGPQRVFTMFKLEGDETGVRMPEGCRIPE